MTINNTWAYNEHDHDYKSAQFLIRSLIEVASKGGNFLLNIGPRPDGTIQPDSRSASRPSEGGLTSMGKQSTARRRVQFRA